MSGILAIVELRDGEWRGVSAEVVSAARTVADQLGTTLDAVASGGVGAGQAAGPAATFGADRVIGLPADGSGKLLSPHVWWLRIPPYSLPGGL